MIGELLLVFDGIIKYMSTNICRENMADEQEQSDEIMALQSIYEDDIFICNASKKPFTGKMFIFLNTDSEDHEFMCNG